MMGKLETEVKRALELVANKQDFVMKGGAGSGKTYSMLSFLNEIYKLNPTASVACVTFTNVAVNEIRARFPTPNLQVSTIHEFLWKLISQYQKDIRIALVELINDGAIKSDIAKPITADYWTNRIVYKEWLNIEDGEISHDELLKVALRLFSEHPVLSQILGDRYDYLLVDEYQDTPPEVLRILLETLPAPSSRTLRLGMFGDGEQAIHEGDKAKEILASAIESRRIYKIEKDVNRRNPAAVIKIINHLRADGLTQVQAEDKQAPNYQKKGSARFVYTKDVELDTERLKTLPFCQSWGFTTDDTKLLYLGKAVIARENHFPQLMAIYDKDRVVAYAKRVRDVLKKKGQTLDDLMTFAEVCATHGDTIKPTKAQATAFDDDPQLLEIASSFAFEDIVTTSDNSDRLLGAKKVSSFDTRDRGEKRDALINHLIAIEDIKRLYSEGRFSAVIRALDIVVTSIHDRQVIADNLKSLSSMDEMTIGEVIDFAEESGILKSRDALNRFVDKHPYRYSRVRSVQFREVVDLYDYVEDHSPFSTQHGVKGSEWDNIFVSLDNGGWNLYNYEKLLAAPDSEGSVEARSRMMLYVACSRAKENLIVYIHQPKPETLSRAKEWFGSENVVEV